MVLFTLELNPLLVFLDGPRDKKIKVCGLWVDIILTDKADIPKLEDDICIYELLQVRNSILGSQKYCSSSIEMFLKIFSISPARTNLLF
jgi:hypothetical protein